MAGRPWPSSSLPATAPCPTAPRSVAVRFARATGSQLHFSAPGAASSDPDVVNYCVPDCNSVEVFPDTLFSVRPVPPAQGTFKLTVLERGGRRVAAAAAVMLLVLFFLVAQPLRFWVFTGGAGLLLLTPMGSRLGLDPLFSPRTYFPVTVRLSQHVGGRIGRARRRRSSGDRGAVAAIRGALAVVAGSRGWFDRRGSSLCVPRSRAGCGRSRGRHRFA